MQSYYGDFEVHLTVRAATVAMLRYFQEWCQQRGCKCIQIILSRGTQPEQPMATWRRTATSLLSVTAEAQQYGKEAEGIGIPVVRLKIEADPQNDEVPSHDWEAAAHNSQNYFEHHVKLARDNQAPSESLLRVCEMYGAHLSRNAFRETSAGKQERFVTLRTYGAGRLSSERQLQALVAALDELGEQIIKHESEYCVYDSNVELDAGWLPKSV